MELEPEEITRKVIAGSMGGVETFLEFNTKVGGEFPEGWLPTLDNALRVSPQNQVEFRFYEKPD